MASSSNNSSQIQNSGSEPELMDQRKRKRMESNRESARKSRMRKQKHLDDLTDQINRMKKDNEQIVATINLTKPEFVKVEAENSVLRAQMSELSQRLDYLNQIINLRTSGYCTSGTSGYRTSGTSGYCTSGMIMFGFGFGFESFDDDFVNEPWNLMYLNQQQQPIMAEMLQY